MIVVESKQPNADVVKYVPRRTSTDPMAALQVGDDNRFTPPFPQAIEELGLPFTFLCDLALKTICLDPDSATTDVAARMQLGLVVTDTLLQRLARDKFLEVKGVVGLHNHRYSILERGWAEVRRITELNSYPGPAPVSLPAYTEKMTQQVHGRLPATRNALDRAMASLILSDSAKQTLGLVASSGRSLFLSGPSGNGKTAMARALVDAIESNVWIPYAIEVDGQIIRLFDPHTHQTVKIAEETYDRRWVKIRPPLVVVGGELTVESMELNSRGRSASTKRPFTSSQTEACSSWTIWVGSDVRLRNC